MRSPACYSALRCIPFKTTRSDDVAPGVRVASILLTRSAQTSTGLHFSIHVLRRKAASNRGTSVAVCVHSINSQGEAMAFAGVIVTFAGFLLAAGSVGLATANSVRLVIVLVAIALCLGGIFGLINPAYQKNAVWKR
jgi:hypothetical protein